MTTKEIAELQSHLLQQQQEQVSAVLEKHKTLFNRKLSCYPHKKIHIDLVDDYKLVFKKAYPVLYQREQLFKKELESLVKDGVLEKCGQSAWALLTFVVPKKDGQV